MEGKNVYDFIAQSLETLDSAGEIISQYQNLEKGRIRIACGPTLAELGMMKALIQFAKDYPKVEINLKNYITNEAVSKVASGSVDLAVINLPYETEYDNIKITELRKTEFCFFVNKKFYHKSFKKDIRLDKIIDYVLAFPDKESNSRKWLDSKLLEHDIKVKPQYEFSSSKLLVKFVEEMDVIGYTNKDFIQTKLKSGELVELVKNVEFDKKAIGIATLDKKMASSATNKLIEYLMK